MLTGFGVLTLIQMTLKIQMNWFEWLVVSNLAFARSSLYRILTRYIFCNTGVACSFCLQILAGRHLFRPGKGIPSPFVEVEILGAYYEDTKKFKTDKKRKNADMV